MEQAGSVSRRIEREEAHIHSPDWNRNNVERALDQGDSGGSYQLKFLGGWVGVDKDRVVRGTAIVNVMSQKEYQW